MSHSEKLLGSGDAGDDTHSNSNIGEEEESTQHQQQHQHHNLPLQPIRLTPQQQYDLSEHLSPSSVISGGGNNLSNIPGFGLDRPTRTSPSSSSSNNNNNNNQNNIDLLDDPPKEKEKKKKDKKKKKKKKKQAEDEGGEDTGDEYHNNIDDDEDRFANEMSTFDKNIKNLSSDIMGGAGDIYMVPRKEKKKKKGKKQREDDNLTPEERRIKEEAKDAKSFFSNERTYLSWIGLTFSLGAIGTSILTFFGTEGVSLATGLFLWITAILFMIYSTIQFRRRGEAIRRKTQGPFDDQKGPLSLVAMVFIGVSIYLVFFVVIRPSANVDIGGKTK